MNDSNNKNLAALAAGIFAAGVAVAPISAIAEEIFVNDNGRVCVRDVPTEPFNVIDNDLFIDSRSDGGNILYQFLLNLFSEETASKANRGLLTTRFSPKERNDGRYDALCDVCATIDFSPDEQDKILGNLGVAEKPIQGKVYAAVVGSYTQSRTLSTSGGNGTETSTSDYKVKSYVATTRSRPYVDALDKLMDHYNFSDNKRVSVLKNLADEKGVIYKKPAVKLYNKWMKMIDGNKDKNTNQTNPKCDTNKTAGYNAGVVRTQYKMPGNQGRRHR